MDFKSNQVPIYIPINLKSNQVFKEIERMNTHKYLMIRQMNTHKYLMIRQMSYDSILIV
jgi:hypothetical protein